MRIIKEQEPLALMMPDNLLRPDPGTIAIEGVDGCGKSSLCLALEQHSEILYAQTPELYHSDNFKSHLAGAPVMSRALLYGASLADRRAMMTEGKLFVTDRSLWSTVAVSWVYETDTVSSVLGMYSSVRDHIPVPELVLVPDVPYEVCSERVESRGEIPMTKEEHRAHLEYYHLLADVTGRVEFISLTGKEDIETVTEIILRRIIG